MKKVIVSCLLLALLCIQTTFSIIFLQGVSQLFGLEVMNKSSYTLAIVDIVYYPQTNKPYRIIVNPGNFYRTRWVTAAVGRDYKAMQTVDVPWVFTGEPPIGRTVEITGYTGRGQKTNTITIGNTLFSNYLQQPSGTYTIIDSRDKRGEISIAQPYNIKVSQ